MVKVHAMDFMELLLKPDIKWVLRGCDAFKELLWMIRFGVYDYQISLWGVLEVGALDGDTQATP